MWRQVAAATIAAGVWTCPVWADTAPARCEIYPAGSDQIDKTVDCTFSQRQGHVTITRADGVTHDLSPVGDVPGNFRTAGGEPVYRQSGLGDLGQIFRFPEVSIFLYWDTGSAANPDPGNPTAPFSTSDYDATALLACDGVNAEDTCPAGIMRMEDAQASITVLDAEGNPFTLNFMKDYTTGEPYVNATGTHTVEARLDGDTWHVTVDGALNYEVPMAAIAGG